VKQVISVEIERELTELEIKVLSIVNELYCGRTSLIDGNEIKQGLKRHFNMEVSLDGINEAMYGLIKIFSNANYEHEYLQVIGQDRMLLESKATVINNDEGNILSCEYKIFSKPLFYVLPKHLKPLDNQSLELLD